MRNTECRPRVNSPHAEGPSRPRSFKVRKIAKAISTALGCPAGSDNMPLRVLIHNPRQPHRMGVKIAAIYACVGALWILLTDVVLRTFVDNPVKWSALQTAKGWAFIAVTSFLVYWLVRDYAAAVAKSGSELDRSERSYRRIIETANEGICSVDTVGNVVFANARFTEMVGYPTAELIGEPLLTLVDTESRHELAGRLQDGAIESGKPCDVKLRGNSGQEIWTLAAISPMFNEANCRVGSLLMFTDISERKRLHSQIMQLQKMEAVGQLAGGIAHDFNNIITTILGNVDLMRLQLKRRPIAVESLAADVDQVERAGERAMALTRQLLAFSRRQPVRAEIVHPKLLLADMEKMLTRLIREDIQLQIVSAEDTPAIRADAGQLEQVIVNLVVNARDAMPNGGKLTVEASGITLDSDFVHMHPEAHEGHHLVIAISDTGHGMDKQTLERIFEPFFTTKPVGQGTGLGLATVYGIIKQFGGHVSVYSEPNVGSTFRVYVPAVQDDAPREGSRLVNETTPGGNETVLVCEDSDSIRNLLCRVLREKGYDVMVADSPEVALDLADQRDGPIHLLITDVIMAGQSGPELAAELQSRRPDLKVLYVSGYTSEMIGQYGLLEDGANFLAKPFTSELLLQKIRDMLEVNRHEGVGT